MTTIHFESDNFGTTVILELIPGLPVRNIRKILKLMRSNPQQNREAIQTVTNYLPDAVSDAKNTYGYAVSLYKDGWRAVPKGYRSVGATEQRRKNRKLVETVKLARIAYAQLTKFQSIFNEIKEKYYA